MTEAGEARAAFRLESECIIRNSEGKIKSTLQETNDILGGFPVLGILELDDQNQVLMHEIRVEMDDGIILRFDLRRFN